MTMKPRLLPLSQWFCDRCGKVIASPEDGIVCWASDDDFVKRKFEIIHKRTSPHSRCDDYRGSWLEVTECIGPAGLRRLISLLHPGEYYLPELSSSVESPAEWAEFFRRLQFPYWEEARQYIAAPNEAVGEILAGYNEAYVTAPEVLLRIIRAGLT